jgi:hypothetical protein
MLANPQESGFFVLIKMQRIHGPYVSICISLTYLVNRNFPRVEVGSNCSNIPTSEAENILKYLCHINAVGK